MNRSWIQLRDLKKSQVLLILPCNAAACVGNYFKAEAYSRRAWNTWREADANLNDLRVKGRVAFAAVDSSTLESQPLDSRGAIVLETEMHRVRNPEGEDWGAPSWRWFRPTSTGRWKKLEELTEALVKGVRRIESMGFSQVLTLVNPRAYFLSLAAAANKCNVLHRWVLFRLPAHPRYLLSAVRLVVPFVRAAAEGKHLRGGVYIIPDFYSILQRESRNYRHLLPAPWKKYDKILSLKEVKKQWAFLINSRGGNDDQGVTVTEGLLQSLEAKVEEIVAGDLVVISAPMDFTQQQLRDLELIMKMLSERLNATILVLPEGYDAQALDEKMEEAGFEKKGHAIIPIKI